MVINHNITVKKGHMFVKDRRENRIDELEQFWPNLATVTNLNRLQ